MLRVIDNKCDSQVNNAATDGIEHVIDPVYGVMPGDEMVTTPFRHLVSSVWLVGRSNCFNCFLFSIEKKTLSLLSPPNGKKERAIFRVLPTVQF